MNILQEKMVELANQKETLKEQMKAVDEKLIEAMKELGVGNAFQDYEGTVWKIQKPLGSFVFYKELDYVRTRREGEVKGSLSKKEAEEMGFILTKGN